MAGPAGSPCPGSPPSADLRHRLTGQSFPLSPSTWATALSCPAMPPVSRGAAASAVIASQPMDGNASKSAQAVWNQAGADFEWACGDPELQRRYEGEFIVVRKQSVLAHGNDRMEALRQAMEAGHPRDELVVVPIFVLAAETPPDAV